MSVEEPADTCYRWSRDFAVAHAMFGTGLITLPVAVLHLAKQPRTGGGGAAFFAVFAVFFAAVSLTLCCRFYAELKRPPLPRWLEPGASASASSGDETTTATGAELPRDDRRRPGKPAVMTGGESYDEHRGGGCAPVCLGEVEKGEEAARLLPACGHVFHAECVDASTSAHGTCPVCRRGVAMALQRPREVVVDIGGVRAQPGAMMPAQPGMIFADQARPGCSSCQVHA